MKARRLFALIFLFIVLSPTTVRAAESLSLVSDTNTQYWDGSSWRNAVPTWITPVWVKIDGATWVWRAFLPDLAHARSGEGPVVMRREFNLTKNYTGVLRMSADDTYQVNLDGDFVGEEGTFTSVHTYELGELKAGNHILEIKVTNVPAPVLINNPNLNPSGIIFRLDLTEKISTSPLPFLRLPWDYEKHGLTFNDAALAINSFFDHEYPLLSVGLVLGEPEGTLNFYNKSGSGISYSSHDGYDYGTRGGARYKEPELAAAAGVATFHNECKPCGNQIRINHGNGFETRYFHMDNEGLLVNEVGKKVPVNQGDQVGLISFTGNSWPAGPAGAHIHFMVVQDKNGDGNFDDNIPDGLVDPFGWQSSSPDPWPAYSFGYAGHSRTGNTSYYLWQNELAVLDKSLPANGGLVKLQQYDLNLPDEAVEGTGWKIKLDSIPAPQIGDNWQALFPALSVTLKDGANNLVTQLKAALELSIRYSTESLKNIKPESLKIISSSDGVAWQDETTNIDSGNQVAKTNISHLSYFALVGERLDSSPPITKLTLQGMNDFGSAYARGEVGVVLEALDASRVLYTVIVLDGAETAYSAPLKVMAEGEHTLSYYSEDEWGNIEKARESKFIIDKTLPEIVLRWNIPLSKYSFTPQNSVDTLSENRSRGNGEERIIYTLTDLAGNKLVFNTSLRESSSSSQMNILSLKYNEEAPVLLKDTFFRTIWSKDKRGNLTLLDQKYVENGKELNRTLFMAGKKDVLKQIYLRTLSGKIYTEVK